MKRWLFLTHRWLGLFGCLLITLWFTSGFVMMYVPFPALNDDERLSALPVIETSQVRVSPAQALAAANGEPVQQLRLLQPADAPIYALHTAERGWVGVEAQHGATLRVTAGTARRAAERFARQPSLSVDLIERDQWSISGSLDAHRPLFAVHMADGGLHYVSSRTGEVVRDTQRVERGWNWVGAVVHWVYPTVLRSRPAAWHWTVIALSVYALLTATLGTAIGLMRWRRYASGRRSPYTGWMRWHHLLGLTGAVFVVGWLFSGLMSMNPGDVFSTGRPLAQQLQAWGGQAWTPSLPASIGAVKEVEWFPDRQGSLTWLRTTSTHSRLLRGEQQVSPDAAFVRERAAVLALGEPQFIERLEAPDLHYHARNAARPLPIWRLRFADPQQTWVHIDGQTGQPFGRIDASNRAARWLYHGLHSWDFEPLLQHRPLWDVLMLAALALGTAFSVTSVVVALRRLLQIRRQRAHSRPGTALHAVPAASHD